MFVATHLIGFASSSGGGLVSITLPSGKKTDGSEFSSTSVTYTSFDFGTAAVNRQIFAGVQVNATSGTPTVSTCTIGGVAGTLIARSSANGNSRVELWAANVPTGTSGNIALTFSGSVTAAGVCTWSVTGAALSASATAEDIDDSDPQTATINCPGGGGVFAVFGLRSAFLGGSGVWSGVNANVHADYAAGSNRWGAGAAQSFAVAQTSLAVSYNYNYSSVSDPTTLWVAVDPA